ncbi:hypothetical protein cyc_07174 [Cyclospora cayetanensis]|uniref:Uncharacterized protein n=1 Tax=Cyclospora cayetanensis TaxID=88456 RepID=A0A1D3D8N7_9EIME|nr:hypothetical protein cyc_07174 [Cyclospora cayetanensis]
MAARSSSVHIFARKNKKGKPETPAGGCFSLKEGLLPLSRRRRGEGLGRKGGGGVSSDKRKTRHMRKGVRGIHEAVQLLE